MPMIVSLISAGFFWQRHTGNILIGLIAIGLIEAVALAAFVMHLLDIETKFYWLKQALPYVSSVAIAELLWNIFIPYNDVLFALCLAGVSLIVVIVWIVKSMQGIEESVKSFRDLTSTEMVLVKLSHMRRMQEQRMLEQFESAAEAYLDTKSIVVDTSTNAITKTYPCPSCATPLSQHQYAVASRYGYCRNCKEKEEN